MTQHIFQQDTDEDRRTLRRLGIVIGAFVVATAIMAITVGLVMN